MTTTVMPLNLREARSYRQTAEKGLCAMKYGNMTWGRMEAVVNKLGGEEGVDLLLSGQLKVERVKYLVDLDANPFIPEGWTVVSHKKGGKFEFDPSKIKLHLSPNQQNGKVIRGTELQKELETVNVYNANLCDFYLANPHLIPEEWKGKEVFFCGTIYRSPGSRLVVRYLYWNDNGWISNYYALDCLWNRNRPAAVAQ